MFWNLKRYTQTLSSTIADHKFYWQLRRRFQAIRFSLLSSLFRLKEATAEARTDMSLRASLFLSSLKTFIYAVLFVVALRYLDGHIPNFNAVPSDGAYVTFFGVVAGVCGVFIGLYFSAVITAAGVVFAQVPSNIRGLLVNDRFGRIYMEFLSFLTFLCLLIIAVEIYGDREISLAIPVIATLAGTAIILFVKYGRLSFNFFDPTTLAQPIFWRLLQISKSATVSGFQWNNPSFQHHNHVLANRELSILETLADICTTERHLRGAPLLRLLQNISIVYSQYASIRTKIPSQSRWFETLYSQKEWYLTSDTETTISGQTKSRLIPNEIRVQSWLEERFSEIGLKCLSANLNSNDLTNAMLAMSYLEDMVKASISLFDFKTAFSISDKISLLIQEYVETTCKERPEKVGADTKILSAVDHISSLYISILLSYFQSIITIRKDVLASKVSKTDWTIRSKIYKTDFSPIDVADIEWISEKIQFEATIEGKRLTSDWYITEFLTFKAAQKFVDAQLQVEKNLFASFQSLQAKFAELKLPWLEAAVLARRIEAQAKLDARFGEIRECFSSILEGKKLLEFNWPSHSIEDLVTICKNEHTQTATDQVRLGFRLTKPRLGSHLLCNHEIGSDGRPVRL